MWRSSMQKRCSGKKNAALDAMLRTADTLSLEHEQKIWRNPEKIFAEIGN